MITIGVTGGMATGKSEVARLLATYGARTIDADKVAHETYTQGSAGHDAIVSVFGRQVLTPEGEINRTALGRLVFTDPSALIALTSIVWPLARKSVDELKRTAEAEGVAVLAIEAVALREAGWQDLVDKVWLVTAPRDQVLARLRQRGGLNEADAEARLATQRPHAEDTTGADLIIHNDGDITVLEAQVRAGLDALGVSSSS